MSRSHPPLLPTSTRPAALCLGASLHCPSMRDLQHGVLPALSGYPQIWLQGTHWWITVQSHPLCSPCHVQQGRGGFPRWQPGGKLEGKLYTSNCMPKETLQKGVENIFHVFCLPHETAEVTPKTLAPAERN